MAKRLNVNDAKFATRLQMTGDFVDTGTGTLFGVPDKRKAGTTRLFLVISTGGSGASAINKAIMTARQKMEHDFSVYSKFLVLDSDDAELAGPSKEGIDTLNTSAPGMARSFVPANRSPFYKSFVPDTGIDLLELGGGDGANRKRMNGKIKLYYDKSGTTNDQALRNKIKGLFNDAGDWSAHKNLPVDIMILTGISGGNGSGTFIDIATIAKSSCFNPANTKVYGFIMLPDTAEGFASGDTERERLYRNGFAALKELESYESIKYELSRKEIFRAPNTANDRTIGGNDLPFDYPILISGNYNEAVGMIAETIVNSASASGDGGSSFNIESFFSNRDDARGSKLTRNAVSVSGILKDNAYPEDSHMYSGIGFAQASIPEKIVIPYIVGQVNKKLYMTGDSSVGPKPAISFCTDKLALDDLQFEQAMRRLLGIKDGQKLDNSSLWNIVARKLVTCSAHQENPYELTQEDLQEGNIQQFISGYNIEGCSTKGKQAMSEYADKLYDTIKENAKGIIKEYGPRVIYYLYEGKGNEDKKGVRADYSKICLKKQIETVAQEFRNFRDVNIPATPDPEGFFITVWKKITRAQLSAWISDADEYASRKIRYNISDAMRGDNGVWQKRFADKMAAFKDDTLLFAQVIESLSGFYQGAGSSLASKNYADFAGKSGELNGINLCKDASMYDWVREKIETKLKDIPIENVSDKLIDSFYADPESWLTEETGVARKQFDMIMSSACEVGQYAKNGLGLTIQDYFQFALKDVPDSEIQNKVNETVGLIFNQLRTKSQPALKLKPETLNNQVLNINIMLPQELEGGKYGQYIKNAFEKAMDDEGIKKHGLAYSSAVDSIVCYQISTGVALASLSELTLWENAYDRNYESTTHLSVPEYPSLHMQTGYSQYNELGMKETANILDYNSPRKAGILRAYEQYPDAEERLDRIYGTGLAWKDYPSINISRYGNDFSGAEGTIEAKYRNEEFTEKINEALRTGIIECEQTKNVYKYYLNYIPQDWTRLSVKNYDTKDMDGTLKRGKDLFEFLREQNRGRSDVYRKQICMDGTGFFDRHGFDFTEIIRAERWGQQRIDETHKLYMMRIMRKCTELYQEMEDTLWKFYPIEKELEDNEVKVVGLMSMKSFIDLFIYGVIDTDEKKFLWTIIEDARRRPEELVKYDIRVNSTLGEIEKKIKADGFRLALTLDFYMKYLDSEDVSIEQLYRVKDEIIKYKNSDDLLAAVKKNMCIIEEEFNAFKEKYGKEDDPLEAIMREYNASADKMEQLDKVVRFYDQVESIYNLEKANLGLD